MTFKISRRLLSAVAALLVVGLIGILFFWPQVSEFVDRFEVQLKVLSLLFGPVATVLGFYLGYQAKREFVDLNIAQKRDFTIKLNNFHSSAESRAIELREQAEQLGEARKAAEQAHKEAEEKRQLAAAAIAEAERRGAAVAKLERDIKGITEGSQELWKLRSFQPFSEYKLWLRDPRSPTIVTFANLKGGVGKTTLAANFAAYLSATKGLKVLVIDLDYQGSLSNMLMLAASREVVESSVDSLFSVSEEDGLARISRAKVQLDPLLSRTWLVSASYPFAATENRLLFKWMLDESEGLDVRCRLAKVLLTPTLHDEFDVVVLDTAPRMTIGTLNALVASDYFVVPTALDKLSAEAVPQFIANMKAIKQDLDLDIELAGIAGVMSRTSTLSDGEKRALELAASAGRLWDDESGHVFRTIIPRRTAIADAAGSNVAYFQADSQRQPLSELFDPLFAEICERIRLT